MWRVAQFYERPMYKRKGRYTCKFFFSMPSLGNKAFYIAGLNIREQFL